MPCTITEESGTAKLTTKGRCVVACVHVPIVVVVVLEPVVMVVLVLLDVVVGTLLVEVVELEELVVETDVLVVVTTGQVQSS